MHVVPVSNIHGVMLKAPDLQHPWEGSVALETHLGTAQMIATKQPLNARYAVKILSIIPTFATCAQPRRSLAIFVV